MQKKIYCVVSFLLMLTFALVGCGASSANLAMEKSESYDAMPMEEMEYAPEAGIT